MADYYTSYGANGDANGGGFMTGGSQDQSAKKSYEDETLRPVTIKQVLEAEALADENFKLDGQPLKQITFVGQIRNVSHQTTMNTYKVDDGTAIIEVKQWVDVDASEEGTGIDEGIYARVFGTLKSFNNKRTVGARPGGLRKIMDHNEVQAHLIEATVVHLELTRGPPGQQDTSGAQQSVNGFSNANGGPPNGGRSLPSSLSAGARRVYACLQKEVQTNEGLHAQDIAARLGMDPNEVESAGAELVNLGLSYSTVDESTWAILDDL